MTVTVTTEELERYATLRAAIDVGGDKVAVLHAHQQSLDAWTDFEARMIEAVADQIDRGEVAGLHAFQRAYDAKRGAAPRPAPPLEAPPEPLGDATEEVDASAIREQLLSPLVPFGATAAPVAALPPAPASTPAAPAHPIAPPQAAAPLSNHTMMSDGAAIRAILDKGALPFAPSLLRAAPPPPRAATPSPQRGLPRMTMDTDPALVGRATTPFDPRTQPTVAPTERLPDPVTILEMARSQGPVPKVTAPPRADAGQGPAVPFERPGDSLMPLERYAEISAVLERERDPMKTFARLGTTPEAWMSTVRSYSRLFANDPSIEARFNSLVKQHKKP